MADIALDTDRLAKLATAFRRRRWLLEIVLPTAIGAALCAAVEGRRRTRRAS